MYDNLKDLFEIIVMILLLDSLVVITAVIAKIELKSDKLSQSIATFAIHTVITIFVTWGVVG